MIAGSPDITTVFSGWYAIRRLGVRCMAPCLLGSPHGLTSHAAAVAILFACCRVQHPRWSRSAARLVFDGAKAKKTPRMVRGKPSLEAIAMRREKKQIAAPLKD
ncbi:hypothetical protein NDU88_007476 [Pleurodeles waltl]|uniref:Uncharacterized protein n=1 Tax=Pleurodeles waltl TaxID=8319 RepID=A0AAV7NWD8_PLEWA|nr:hypothetical protein NDU88_007476 [Pleurodeles waltl]